MWSVGCILAEMLMKIEGCRRWAPDESTSINFLPGRSCYPLSPPGKSSSDHSDDGTENNTIKLDEHD